MGAIAAVLNVEPERVDRMLAAAPHRGPAIEVVARGMAAVGIRRGTFTDVTSLASDDRYVVAFNGVLDDWAVPGHDDPDPARAVLDAFRAHGPDAPRLMRGAYAVVVTDGKSLWCWRDHVAFRSLFYRRDGDSFYAASEVKQVVAGAGLPSEPDLDVIEQIFYATYSDETPTALKGAERLPKMTLLHVDGSGDTTRRRYWEPERLIETARLGEGEVKERFDSLFTQAVTRCLGGEDVVSLSGGIDSSAIAAYMAPVHRQRTGAPLAALSAVYPDHPSVDERSYIEAISEALGMRLHTYVPRARLHERLKDYVELMDGPVPTVALEDLEEAYVEARRHGYRTLHDGEVAEFVFDMRRYLTPHLLLKGKFGTVRDRLAIQTQGRTSWFDALRALSRDVLPYRVGRLHARVRRPGLPPAPDWLNVHRLATDNAEQLVPARRRWRDQQLKGFIGPGLTIEADEILENLHDVRLRRPWADIDLWEFFLSVPAEVKHPDNGPKTLMRRLLRGRVPDLILDRTDKTLFTEFTMSRVNYPALRRWLIDPDGFRMPDVDYERLAEHIEREDMDQIDFHWAKDLAAVHAFLDLWR